MERKRASVVASGLLAKPGAAPARATPVEDLPRPASTAAPPPATNAQPPAPGLVGGIKAATVGTTVYLLPGEHKRVRRLALDLDVSVHELLLLGLERDAFRWDRGAVVIASAAKQSSGQEGWIASSLCFSQRRASWFHLISSRSRPAPGRTRRAADPTL
jgi:hypothetical protein